MTAISEKLDTLFGGNLRFSERVIQTDSSKQIKEFVEKDEEFIKNVRQVKQHSKTIQKEVMAKRANLTEEEYQFVQATGAFHYPANILNSTSALASEKIDPSSYCKCGCKRAIGEPLPFCENQEEQTFLGPGVILFFYYTKRIFLVVCICLFIYGILSLVTNLISNQSMENCEKPGALFFLCNWKIQSQISNKTGKDQYLIPQLWLGFLMCVFWSIAVRFLRALGRRKNQEIDEKLDSSADSYIFLENLPVGNYHEEDLLEFVSELWENLDQKRSKKLKIKSVQIIYNMDEVRQKIAEIYKLAREICKFFDGQTTQAGQKIKKECLEEYKTKKEQIINLEGQLKKIRGKFMSKKSYRAELTGECALIEFSDPEQLDDFVEKYGQKKESLLNELIHKIKRYCKESSVPIFKERNIKILKSPEPSDILWQHCQKKNTVKKTIIVWVLNIILSGLSFGAFELLRSIKSDNSNLEWLQIVSLFLINLFNRLIWNILLYIVQIEENYTKTINIVSVMNKSYISHLVNIILVPLIIFGFQDENIDGPNGLAGQVHDFQLTAFFFMTLFNLINVPHRIVRFIECVPCLRRMAIKYFCRITGQFDTYDEMRDALTFLYDPPLVPVAGLYVYITTIISQAFFYCHLQPIILFYLACNLVLFHFINKYLIFRMCKITDLLDVNIFQTVVGFALNIPCIYGLSNILFLYLKDAARDFSYYVPGILCLIVWFLSVQSPFGLYKKIVQFLMKFMEKDEPEKTTEEGKEEGTTEIIKAMVESREDINPMKSTTRMNQQFKIVLEGLVKKGLQIRKENFYKGTGTNELFNYENKLNEVKGRYHNKNQDFCEKFNLGYEEDESQAEDTPLEIQFIY